MFCLGGDAQTKSMTDEDGVDLSVYGADAVEAGSLEFSTGVAFGPPGPCPEPVWPTHLSATSPIGA